MGNLSSLRIVLVNIHGLLRGKDLELGKDSDTGGQTKYVLELAEALSKHENVEEVTILTRLVFDPKLNNEYAMPEEKITDKVKIVRIACGPKRYLRKEMLWPHLDTFIDRSLNYFRRVGRIPHVFHGHYADSGYVASQLARLLLVPSIFTGHSLGRVKEARLLEQGKNPHLIEKQFNLSQRIEAEEFSLDTASIVITNTVQEVEEQYSLYEQYQPATMEVIPPGVDLRSFMPPDKNQDIESPVIEQINQFLKNPDKPVILVIARPNERKNIETLIKAYGKSETLKEKANLVLIVGNRDSFDSLHPTQQKVLIGYVKLIDKYNLYGKVAYPKNHALEEVPIIYRWVAKHKGVFVNPALTEPFGLTLLESAASGLPVVATNDGGPRDIISTCQNGILIDPLDHGDMEKAILRILTDEDLWKEFSENGIKKSGEHYSWNNHVNRYVKDIFDIFETTTPRKSVLSKPKKSLPDIDRIIITDIDNTLTGDDEALKEFIDLINNAPLNVGFGIATGRKKEDALKVLEENGVPHPSLLISSVGTEIYYGRDLVEDRSWRNQINYRWEPDKIRTIMNDINGIYLQDENYQAEFKISYQLDTELAPKISDIRKILRVNKIKAKVIVSLGSFLDIIPMRAGDGLAVRQLAFRWGIPWEKILIAGDCGNDEAMLKGATLAVVVSNYSPELKKLKMYPRIYFASQSYARGIIEGINYYNFLNDIEIPNDFTKK